MIELAVVVPTFNERANVEALVAALDKALTGIAWEAIFVDDDSPDGTASLLRDIGRKDARIRCLLRIGRRGLSSASIEGMMATAAPYVAVIDGDLQHDETILPAMLARLRQGDVDIVVGTRYAEGGKAEGFSPLRGLISRAATIMGRLVVSTPVSDPMSGFFMMRREALENTARHLAGKGFKILLDILASAPRPLRIAEISYHFRNRHAGESKLDTLAIWEYVLLLSEKLFGERIPFRFVMFGLVGGLGLLFHLALLGLFYLSGHAVFWAAQTAATGIVILSNFTLNNLFTYRDRRLRGKQALWGLSTFAAACAVGAFVNLRVAIYLYDKDAPWWLAGMFGALIGAVWNYAVTATFTWRQTHRHR